MSLAQVAGPERPAKDWRSYKRAAWSVIVNGAWWGTNMRVLLIEDDSATAQSIELMLKSENFNVYATDLGEEGVELYV